VVGRDAGGGDGFAAVEAGGDLEIEGEELGEEVGIRASRVSKRSFRASGVDRSLTVAALFGGRSLTVAVRISAKAVGVEGGVGVAEGILAGKFKRAVEGAESAGDVLEGVGADAADLAGGSATREGGQGGRKIGLDGLRTRPR
jgi:hypothetical protein